MEDKGGGRLKSRKEEEKQHTRNKKGDLHQHHPDYSTEAYIRQREKERHFHYQAQDRSMGYTTTKDCFRRMVSQVDREAPSSDAGLKPPKSSIFNPNTLF